jgi:hypothetical protein
VLKSPKVCTNNGTDVDAHLSYDNSGTTYITDSATYIQQQFQSGGLSGPSPGLSPGTGNNSAALSSLGVLLGAPSGTSCATPTSVAAVVAAATSTGRSLKDTEGLVAFALKARGIL